MNGHKIQAIVLHKNESVLIVYEDWISGENDTSFRIDKDGVLYDYENDKTYPPSEAIKALFKLVNKVDMQVADFYQKKGDSNAI